MENCPFCDRQALRWRTVRADKLFTSFVSSPWFRSGHCLVAPQRHVHTIGELTGDEAAAVLLEIGRLSTKLSDMFGGFGSGVMQKYQPLQAENGVKVNHLHLHVFPRKADEPELFPVPTPNSFPGFYVPPPEEVTALVMRLT